MMLRGGTRCCDLSKPMHLHRSNPNGDRRPQLIKTCPFGFIGCSKCISLVQDAERGGGMGDTAGVARGARSFPHGFPQT